MFRKVTLPTMTSGTLFLHSMPGRDGEWYEEWDEFFAATEEKRVDRIVCLTGMDEIREKSPDYAVAIEAGKLPCERTALPIADYGVPEDWEAYADYVKRAAERVRSGERVLIHCAGGVGRTGTFAVCLLHHFGFTDGEAQRVIRAARSEPETPEQEELVSWHSSLNNKMTQRVVGSPKPSNP